ncbi:hypothetical protein Daus18300_001419 [Diaporthe australafricana]|uniref:RBR-type E3 ubiquitin transferase n=1 Tax=Diaporthe australafricana TaxID=127596 RepID=A0ABR3XVL9_9PEZI
MSSNDGKQLLVFGLGFAQHDNRKMQQLLRHYSRLPDNPGSRAELFVQLNKVAKELMAYSDETAQTQIQQLTDWMTKGGDFPLSPLDVAPASTTGDGTEPQSSQAMKNNHGSGLFNNQSVLAHRQGYYGQGRTLSGQQSTATLPSQHDGVNQFRDANFGRQHGRGRTVSGDWEENEDEEDEEDVGDANEEEEDDDDESMHDFVGGPRGHMDREEWLDNAPLAWGNAFSGRGRTLNDPTDEDGASSAENEENAAASTEVEGQVADRPQNQPGEIEAGGLDAGIVHSQNQTGLVETTERFEDLEEDPSHSDSSMLPDEPDDEEEIECPICLEDYPRSRFPKRHTITEMCDHPDKACLSCLDSSITAIIERGALHILACPICPQKLSHRDIKGYANRAVYKRYKYLKQQSQIPGHYISCTNPICGGSQPHESENPMMICNHCEFATCAKHRRPWHEGQTCQEFDLDDAQIERLEEEEATAKLLSGEDMSICPKCGQGVTKTEGCDHMQCQCGTEWCYICSCSYENIIRLGPTAHATFCTYHPNKVSLSKSQQEAARTRIMGLVHGGEVSAELARAREDLRRRRREEIRPKAAEAAEARLRLQQEQSKGQAKPDGPPDKKKRKVKLLAPWEEGGWVKKAL